jgi:hypothetical protein
MESPISSLIAQIFLQEYEDKNIKNLIDSTNIAYYARYVDDILIIFDTTKINLHTITRYINNIHSNIKTQHHIRTTQFHRLPRLNNNTPTQKTVNRHIQKANYHGHNNELHFKPPHRTKKGSLQISPYQNALSSTRSKQKTKGMEDNTNNSKKQQLIQKLNQRVQQKTNQNPDKKDNKIWTTFTYHSPKIRTITNLFKNTNVNIAFRTTTTTQQYIKQNKTYPYSRIQKNRNLQNHMQYMPQDIYRANKS